MSNIVEDFNQKVSDTATEAKKKLRKGKSVVTTTGKKAWHNAKVFGLGLLIGALIVSLLPVINFGGKEKDTIEEPGQIEDHDMALDNDGWFGYTAADFEDAVLESASQEKKLIVYTAEVSDVVKLTDTGLANLKVFTKTQYISFTGTVNYTVDLAQMTRSDITLDKDTKTLTIRIPHATQGQISTPASEMVCQDLEKGALAFGDLKLTPENFKAIEMEATEKMAEKLSELSSNETADRFAKLSVWEIYQPIVTKLSPLCRVEIEFTE